MKALLDSGPSHILVELSLLESACWASYYFNPEFVFLFTLLISIVLVGRIHETCTASLILCPHHYH